MSMSSASVYRNNNLRNLDDQFDRIEREYELDDDDEWCEDDDDDVSIAPSYMSSASRVSMFKGGDFEPGEPLQVTRDDFDAIMDDFLENYEVVGNRMRESLGGTALSGPEKLKVLRSALEQGDEGLSKEENRRRILALEKLNRGPLKEDKERIPRAKIEPAKEDKWDVETILCELGLLRWKLTNSHIHQHREPPRHDPGSVFEGGQGACRAQGCRGRCCDPGGGAGRG
jgi:protein LTV1